MDSLGDVLKWAWARHHNPLSWYIRPLFILPFCYFAAEERLGIVITVVAVTSSMFGSQRPPRPNPRPLRSWLLSGNT